MTTFRLLGLMSGSSLDGLDLALCHFHLDNESVVKWEIEQAATLPYTERWSKKLRTAASLDGKDLVDLDYSYGALLGQLCIRFLKKNKIKISDVTAVASHGHTLFHEPKKGFTFQLGHGAAIAAQTGLTTICDFRASDVALGGQGAPLAPLVDRLFYPEFRLFLNIGGIANISAVLPDKIVAFDVTGANQVLDALAAQAGKAFDKDGKLAASADGFDSGLSTAFGKLSFYTAPFPKSLSNQWVQKNMVEPALASPAPVPAKLQAVCHHIGYEVARAIGQIKTATGADFSGQRLFITGGGAFNKYLVETIKQYTGQTHGVEVHVPEKNIVNFKEALLMALMGAYRLEGIPNCIASVTGASKDAIGGTVFLP